MLSRRHSRDHDYRRYPITAQSIAAQIGLQNPDRVITGAELEEMDDAQLKERVHEVNVFARVVPEQKLRLVNALKASGEVVGCTVLDLNL